MTYIEAIEDLKNVNVRQYQEPLTDSFLNSFFTHKKLSALKLKNKEELLTSYIDFLNNYIALEDLDDATLITLMDYLNILNHRKVELELASGKKTKEEIEKTAKRFRKKAQSAVSG